ncbi:glycoside hydrolase family 3 N-terminal domain-containing protein [Aquimarina sp. 2201CG5-10]|uniref:glycoside hydrolase family 3 N-terminal domain-containing protein n=1 Tax=Aquimarina callyspongiae TaxID=3098150 RepID=UPI002AB4500C|nr:glycoside hydrolase family 3 N-terminal domain-containing protein [Aquimarina sp. 2201CG5-10]MDY8134754.1 glycoside hydrolase family 3 N-terminal domain-containing protein [Aquimarina sp. 2201CG5-10]
MQKVFIGLLVLILVGCNTESDLNQKESVSKESLSMSSQIDEKVAQLLSEMTLEEKVGQMTQITLDVVTKGDNQYSSAQPYQLDSSLVHKAIHTYKVGSILNTPGIPLSRQEWYNTIKSFQDQTAKTPRQIPIIYGIDAIHGVNYTTEATLFPQQIGLAATFNTDLVKEVAKISAYETRASSIPWNFSPVLGLGRNPLWPRLWETFGEDVYLGKTMGVAMIEGYQGELGDPETVASCMKHYLGYSVPLSGKDRTPAWIPERELRQYFLPAFQDAVDAGSVTLMINSGEINGVPVHASKFLLTDVLRNELGFEGIAVTDWADINYLHTKHKVAETIKDAIKISVNAGIDMSMVPHDFEFTELLIELVKEGSVSEERINSAVTRILKVKFQLDLFNNPVTDPKDYPDFGSEKFAKVSKQAAIESITLLKNKNDILPLSKDSKILVTGPTSNSMRPLNGGWSYNWQGSEADKYAKDMNTVAEAFVKNGNATFVQGVSFDQEKNIDEAVSAATQSDIILLCLGENSYTETPGNTHSILMPSDQIELTKALAKTGKKIILVLLEGRPIIFNEIEPLVDAVFMGYLPGNYGADALVDLVYGIENPSGKLPINYPKHPHAFVNYNHKHSDNIRVDNYYESDYDQQYEFGDGLSYTSFKYSDLRLSSSEMSQEGFIEVTVRVTNTGNRKGKETVLLFLSDLYASITPEVRALKGYKKIELDKEESKTVTFRIAKEELSFVNEKLETVAETGDFEINIGGLTKKFRFK